MKSLGVLYMFVIIASILTLAQTNPVPLINQPLVPDAAKPGGNGFKLTVNGTGFVSSSAVNWNGSARATTFVSGSQLTASILASDIAKADTASVTVVNSSPGGGTSNVAFFEVTIPTSTIALAKSDYSAGSGPVSVATADFNQDGALDLGVTNVFSNTVSVLLGNGDGTFRGPTDYGTGIEPASVAVGDFNGDGKADLAVVNACGEDPRCLTTSPGTVSILLGTGDGTFESKVDYGTGDFPGFVALADVNADGNLDLVVTNGGSNTVSVLLGNGDGTFGPKADYPTGNGPDWVAVGDFNGDGKLDLAVANYYDATVSVLLGNGDGTFQSGKDYATGRSPGGGTVGDFNGDGKLDLAVPNFDDNTVSVLLGKGDGTFGAKADYVTGSAPVFVSGVDLNGDDKPDLVVANNGSDTVSVLFGNGDGTFQTHSDYATGHLPTDVAVGDFNRDGRLDLAVSDSESAVSVLLQTAAVTISPGSLEFRNQLLGTKSAAQKVTVTNNAGVPLSIASIVISGTDKSDFLQRNNCGSKLPPGAHCTIRVVFAPTETGPLVASVMITDSAPGSPQSVTLSGTGIASGPNVTLSTKNLTFDTQFVGTTSPPQPVRLINYGTETLSISSIVASGDFDQKNDCGSSLPPEKHCTIKVTFTPSRRGERIGTVLITDNAPNSPQKISLKGAGTVVKFNPAKLNFGAVELGKTKTLSTILTNTGSTTLDITGITIKGIPPDDFFQKNTCDGRVGAGKSCTITVTFEPAEKNERSADVSVSDNGGGGQQQVSLSGSGSCFLNRCHVGYCYVDDTTGNLNGSCVSHTVMGFCDIQPSGNCPSGERAIHPSVTPCGGFLPAPIDLARPCSF